MKTYSVTLYEKERNRAGAVTPAESEEDMKSYYVIFYNGNKKVCGTWKRASDKDRACMLAEFSLMCNYPNVTYTNCKVVNEAE